MTIHPFNVDYLLDLVKYFYLELNVNRISIGIVQKTIDLDSSFAVTFFKQIQSVANYIITNEIHDLYIYISYKMILPLIPKLENKYDFVY